MMPGFKEIIPKNHFHIEKSGNSVIMVKEYEKRKRNYDHDF